MSSQELTEWMQFYAIRAEEDDLRRRGFDEDQIADLIEGHDDEDGGSGLLGALGVQDVLTGERYLRSLELAQDLEDDEDG